MIERDLGKGGTGGEGVRGRRVGVELEICKVRWKVEEGRMLGRNNGG